ncbi:MAG: carbohydrate ABC transporter permease [Oliverpabstia sp.]
MKTKKEKKISDLSELVFRIISSVVIISFTIACIYPFWYIFVYSISDPSLAQEGIWLLPKGFSLKTYTELLGRNDILRAYVISILRTVIGTVLTIGCTSILAFLVTRPEMIGRKFVYRFIVVTMYVNAGLIPWYLVMRAYHLEDTFLVYIIPSAVNAYYMILIKTYMEQIPVSMEESAKLEGAGFFDILFRIIMPLSKPILATCTVYAAVAQWNSWSDNFFLVRDSKLQTVQLILRNYLTSAESIAQAMKSGGAAGMASAAVKAITPTSIQMVTIMVATIPILFVYPFAQKYFTKGIMMGAIKG